MFLPIEITLVPEGGLHRLQFMFVKLVFRTLFTFILL
jgi:hypothetical protein